MGRWQTKESFIKSIEDSVSKSKYDLLVTLKKYFNIYPNEAPTYSIIDEALLKKIFPHEYAIFNDRNMSLFFQEEYSKKKNLMSVIRNANVNINYFKKIINDEVLTHINNFFYDDIIEPFEYQHFLICVHHIDFFKQSGLSTHKSKYDAEIKQLKKRADELQYYSKEDIEIILPRLPQFTLAHFKWTSESNETIKRYFYDYFNKKRYPNLKTLELTYNEIIKEYKPNRNTNNIWEEYFNYKAKKNSSNISRLKKDR